MATSDPPDDGARDDSQDESGWEKTLSRDVVIGKTIGEYVVRQRIGSGGMGVVYEGEQPLIGRRVAIKILRGDVEHASDLLDEARVVNSIHHRGIVDIYGFGELPGIGQYLVMEFLDGKPLDAVLEAEAPMSAADVIPILDQILEPLEAAHTRGVVHRDLKPSNVFLVEQPGGRYVKLLDFGLAKRMSKTHAAHQTRVTAIVGTPYYMAPELAKTQTVGPKTDLYAVGVLAFEMLTGRVPFDGAQALEVVAKHVHEAPPRPSEFHPVPQALEDLVLQLLAKKPEQRPTSAQTVRHSLKRILKDLGDAATKMGPAPATRAPSGPSNPVAGGRAVAAQPAPRTATGTGTLAARPDPASGSGPRPVMAMAIPAGASGGSDPAPKPITGVGMAAVRPDGSPVSSPPRTSTGVGMPAARPDGSPVSSSPPRTPTGVGMPAVRPDGSPVSPPPRTSTGVGMPAARGADAVAGAVTQPPQTFRGGALPRPSSPGTISGLTEPAPRPETQKVIVSSEAEGSDTSPQARPKPILDTQRIARDADGHILPETSAPAATPAVASSSTRPWLLPLVGVGAIAVALVLGAYVAKVGPFAPDVVAPEPGLTPITPKRDARPPTWIAQTSGEDDHKVASIESPPVAPKFDPTPPPAAPDAGAASPIVDAGGSIAPDAGLALEAKDASVTPDSAVTAIGADAGEPIAALADAGGAAQAEVPAAVNNAGAGELHVANDPADAGAGVTATKDAPPSDSNIEPARDLSAMVTPATDAASRRTNRHPTVKHVRGDTTATGTGVLEVGVIGHLAEVFVDGESVGATPFKGDVEAGDHRVRVQVQNAPSWTGTVKVKAGASARVVKKWNAEQNRLDDVR